MLGILKVCIWGGGRGRRDGKHGRDIYKVPKFNRTIVSIRKIWSATEKKKKGLVVIISDFWAI